MKRNEMYQNIVKNHADLFMSLYERWQDEKAYEDFNEYVTAFKNMVPDTIKGLKRPFGFIVKCSDGDLKIFVRATKKTIEICGQFI